MEKPGTIAPWPTELRTCGSSFLTNVKRVRLKETVSNMRRHEAMSNDLCASVRKASAIDVRNGTSGHACSGRERDADSKG